MGTRLYVSGLSFSTTSTSLGEAFARFGELSEAVVMASSLGRSLGFGFVTFTDDAAANVAVAEMDGTELEGRIIAVGKTSLDNPASSPTCKTGYHQADNLNLARAPIYADNTAAKKSGLSDGDVYRTAAGILMVAYT
jgi:RNA recognition motif-containing protein